uniref:GCP_N_terminal domain-containing protein n=1 Tax=Anisakis simplex TaxID=6269 RepID=A0A0M3J605_ANISI
LKCRLKSTREIGFEFEIISAVFCQIIWYRHERPSKLPNDIRPTIDQLSSISLRYCGTNTVTAITDFCANLHCAKSRIDTLIVNHQTILKQFRNNLQSTNIFCTEEIFKSVCFFKVEVDDDEVAHQVALGTLLALLSDACRCMEELWPSKTQASDVRSLRVLTMIRSSNQFDHLMVSSLYTDCMVFVEDSETVRSVLA